MFIVNQRKQQMLKRRIFMTPRPRRGERVMQGCFQFTGK
jgi:hypothetical protein